MCVCVWVGAGGGVWLCGSLLEGFFRVKVNRKTRNASHILNKAEPSSPDPDGGVLEKSRRAPLKKEENNYTASPSQFNPIFLPNNMPYTGILKSIWHMWSLMSATVGRSLKNSVGSGLTWQHTGGQQLQNTPGRYNLSCTLWKRLKLTSAFEWQHCQYEAEATWTGILERTG